MWLTHELQIPSKQGIASSRSTQAICNNTTIYVAYLCITAFITMEQQNKIVSAFNLKIATRKSDMAQVGLTWKLTFHPSWIKWVSHGVFHYKHFQSFLIVISVLINNYNKQRSWTIGKFCTGHNSTAVLPWAKFNCESSPKISNTWKLFTSKLLVKHCSSMTCSRRIVCQPVLP